MSRDEIKSFLGLRRSTAFKSVVPSVSYKNLREFTAIPKTFDSRE